MSVKRMLIFLGAAAIAVGVARTPLVQAAMGHSSSAAAANATAPQNADSAPTYDIATPHDAPIPKNALRLRIIANSDSIDDQNTKLAVRDAIVVQVAQIVKGAKDAEEAKTRVEAALPQLRATALEVTRKRGYDYPVTADVGQVPFPTKVYGNQVYPAGNYEALRITLGKGSGQNWWCVLFPPLCFVDIADGDAVPNTGGFPDLPPLETIQVPGPDGQPKDVQVRLAVEDYGETAVKAVKNWFNHG